MSDKQENLTGPQDEPEKPEEQTQEPEISDEFDWLDDLVSPTAESDGATLSLDDLGDDLDWMALDDAALCRMW